MLLIYSCHNFFWPPSGFNHASAPDYTSSEFTFSDTDEFNCVFPILSTNIPRRTSSSALHYLGFKLPDRLAKISFSFFYVAASLFKLRMCGVFSGILVSSIFWYFMFIDSAQFSIS